MTVPTTRGEPDLLLRRFAEACGFDAAWCDATASTPNESLSAEAAVLLSRLGPAVAERVDFDAAHWTDRYRWLRRYLGHDLLVPQPGHRIGVPAHLEAALDDRSRRSRNALVAAGYRVVGDLEELVGVRSAPGSVSPDEVRDEDVLALAVPVMADLLARVREETLRREGTDRQGGA